MGLQEFPTPAHWFGPRTLRRWLWLSRNRIKQDTRDSLQQMLIDEHIVSDIVNIHELARLVIVNVDYTDIIACLNEDDFLDFVEDAKDYWTSPERLKEVFYGVQFRERILLPQGTLFKFKDSYHSLRNKLTRYYRSSKIQSHFSMVKFEKTLKEQSFGIKDNIEMASFKGGIQQAVAAKNLVSSFDIVIKAIERFYLHVLKFINDLLAFCGMPVHMPKDGDWGSAERAMSQACDEFIGQINDKNIDERIQHLSHEILAFCLLFWSGSQHEVDIRQRSIGEIASSILNIRRSYRNIESHAAKSFDIDLAVAHEVLEISKTIKEDLSKFMDIIGEEGCFPEIVRIVSIEKWINGLNIKATTLYKENEYQIMYADEMIMEEIAREALYSMVYEEKDQDFWLFPASGARTLFNPLLIPFGNSETYRLNVRLLAEIPEPIASEQAEEPYG